MLKQSLIVLTALLLFALPATGVFATDPDTVADIRIIVHCAPEKQDLWTSVARSTIPLQTGDPYSLDKISEAVTALKNSLFFEHIHVPDPQKQANGMVLFFELTPFSRISEIKVNHAFPLFEQEVLNVMTIRTGGIYQEDKVAPQAQRVEKLFKERGFYDPKATVTATPDQNQVRIVVDIQKGPFYRIRKIVFKGNQNLSSARLKLSLKTWRTSLLPFQGNRFTQKEMDEDIKELTRIFRQKGYAEVLVTARQAVVDGTHEVDVVFTITEGPLYRISFTGNETLSQRKLNKELLLKKDGNKNNFALRRSLRNIKKLYAQHGFPDARIKEEKGPDSPDTGWRQVDIRVNEGPRYRVSELTLPGATTLPLKQIKKNILTSGKGGIFDAGVLEEDLAAITALYLKEGFTRVKADKKVTVSDGEDKAQKAVIIDITIKEGPRTTVEDIELSGMSALAPDDALAILSLKQGQWYDASLIEADTAALQQAVAQQGFPHVEVTCDTIFSKDLTRVKLDFHIDQGPKVCVGRIFYAGHTRLRESELAEEMEIGPGDPFSLLNIVDSRRNIQGMNAVDTVRIRSVGLKTREPEADLVVEVTEKKPYFVELAGGYDTERHLYTEGRIGDKNFTGRNLNIEAGLELSQVGYQADIALTEPRFLSSRLISHSRAFTQEQEEFNKDYGISTYGLSQDFSKDFFDKKLKLTFGIGYEFRDQYLRVDRALTDDEEDDYGVRHIGQFSTGATFRTTDSYVHPKKGMFVSSTLDIFKGIDDTLDDFFKIRLDARYYYPAADSLTLAFRGGYGYMQSYGGNTHISDDQLFYLGGTSTIRGFDENMLRFDEDGNAIGGRAAAIFSVEARYEFFKDFEAALFFDTGAVRRIQEGVDESFRSSIGVGIRRQTPVGPLSFLYAWKLDPEPGEDPGCFHFSLGYTF